MFTKKFLLILIFIAIITRFIRLDYVPPHLSNDEIGASYAAYSISKTFRDGTNQFLPLLWVSHGGYGSPLAVYIPLISIIILGNNDIAVRLPSAILGSLTVILIGLLVMRLTENGKLAIATSFVLAFSPWHFSASRWALESNYALFFIVLGLYLFFLGFKDNENTPTKVGGFLANRNKNWITLLSFISFALSIYSYYTQWVLTPLIILLLFIFYRKILLKKKAYFAALLLFGVLIMPLFSDWLFHLSSSRASSEFISKDIGVGRLLSKYPGPFEKGQIILKAILDKYSLYTSPDYLFFYGARLLPKENPYQFGFFLSPLLIPFIWGLYKLKALYREHGNFIYALLIVSPLTAAITQGEVNNWRSLPQLLPIAIITAVGVLYTWDFVRKNFWMKTLGITVFLVSLLYFSLIYFFHFPIENAEGYQYGYKQMALYISQHYPEFERIIIDPRFGSKSFYYIGVPSSYIPFYTYLDPHKVQNAKVIPFGITFDKYEFREINWDEEKIQKNYLYIVPNDNIPNSENNLKIIHEIPLPSRKIEFKLYSAIN